MQTWAEWAVAGLFVLMIVFLFTRPHLWAPRPPVPKPVAGEAADEGLGAVLVAGLSFAMATGPLKDGTFDLTEIGMQLGTV